MTPTEFEALKFRRGWEALAAENWKLRPCESAVLAQLVFHPGRVFSLAEIGQPSDWHGRCTGSEGGARKRVERLRAKLADVGLVNCIETLPAEGYAIPAWLARRIDGALKYACGVDVPIDRGIVLAVP